MNNVAIAKVGKFKDMHGTDVEFSEKDLQAIASAYDPQQYKAPIRLGHPSTDTSAPAYGWVEGLSFSDGLLNAAISPVEELVDWVKRGFYGPVSPRFHTPKSPANPNPGQFSIIDFGFLGEKLPAITGLPAIECAGNLNDAVTIEFSQPEPTTSESPQAAVEPEASTPIPEEQSPQSDAGVPEVTQATVPSPDDQAALLKQLQADLAEAQSRADAAEAATAAAQAEKAEAVAEVAFSQNLSFAQGCAAIPEEQKEPIASVLTWMVEKSAGKTDVVEFAQGEATVTQDPVKVLKDFLGAIAVVDPKDKDPKTVEFGQMNFGNPAPLEGGSDDAYAQRLQKLEAQVRAQYEKNWRQEAK